ncbi:Rec8 like protein-domain-containing protein [Sphaerosporella brunnea]|uniref:Rec8 like protein-domain-containing protein n=1 Tax=Sphaerosporella brunnea TaxID=1250544 RepID=A0A5J5EQE8_9PEZI|nr:Rec8 like protein-domain-containing protein [Sphaerosporella brunnea]
MFYSESLLSKTGPLARVWLSANLERKLSKTHILQSNIETSVDAIVGQDQAPMALRLSGQLLLGVVRIYSRKARYLLEDCNEALMKIKMAFRPGNVDLPAGAISHTSAQLTLPDVITELDLLLPDPTLDLADLGILPLQPGHQKRNADITLDSDSFVNSLEQPRGFDGDDLQLEDDILDIDIGEDNMNMIGGLEDLMGSDSLEIGRDAHVPRDIGEDLFSESRMSLDLGEITPKARESMAPGLGFEEDGLDLGFDDDNNGFGRGMDIDFEGDTTIQPNEATPVPEATASVREPEAAAAAAATAEPARERTASVAPTLEMQAPAEEQEEPRAEPGDETFVRESSRLSSEEIEEMVHVRVQGSRKRKVVIDSVTEIKAKVIKAQQEDRSRILKEPSFLPRDPTVLALMSLTKTGGLARSVFYPRNIAPELANLLAPDFVKRMAELKKRKRESAEEQDEARPSPPKQARLELQQEEELVQPELDFGGEMLEEPRDEMMELAGDVSAVPFLDQEEEELVMRRSGTTSPQPEIVPQGDVTAEGMEAMGEPVDELTFDAPQPVSRETRHAVHVLREQFAEPNPKPVVRFKELLPPQTTTKVDATKMFFEVLVLATKDAVKVKQSKGFGEIEIQQKKALWGSWAEEKDEQQVAEEEERLREEKDGGRTMDVVVGTGRTVGEATAAA